MRRSPLFAAASLVLVAAGCAPDSRGRAPAPADAAPAARTAWGETVVARVGAGVVTRERLDRRLRGEIMAAQRLGRPAPTPRRVLDALVDEELLVQEAVRQGALARDDDVRERLRRWLDGQQPASAPAAPSSQAVAEYWKAHQAEFPAVERLHVRHLLVRVSVTATPAERAAGRRRAEALHAAAVRRPTDFAGLARAKSDDPSAQFGGDLGQLGVAQLALILGPQLPAAQRDLAPGQIGPVLESRHGFHVFQLVARRPAGADAARDHEAAIAARLQGQARDRARQAALSTLRASNPVTIHEATLAAVAAGLGLKP
jgi:parvulin-like peptidyl-prolyl isomerase